MKRLLLIACIFIIGCAQVESEECYQQIIVNTTCEEPPTTYCPFNTCFSKSTFTSHEYFSVKPISVGLSDATCNDAFEEEYTASSYVCFIKNAEIVQEMGRDEDGNALLQWDVDCACSFE